jgi:general secretion pathway protein I
MSAPRGFTLVEVLAALLLMSIALPAIMHAVSVASHAADSARHRTEASLLASSKLNELVSTGQYQSQTSGDFGTDWPQSQYTWTAQTLDWTPTNNNANVTPTLQQTMTEVDVTVKWGQFDSDQVTLSTLVYPNNPISTQAITNAASAASGTTP